MAYYTDHTKQILTNEYILFYHFGIGIVDNTLILPIKLLN